MFERWLVGLGLSLVGCAAAQQAATSPEAGSEAEPASAAPSSAPAGDAQESPEPAAAEAAPEPSNESPASAGAAPSTPAELCNQACARIGQECSSSAARDCRVNCRRYESPKPECEAVARAAMACFAKAPDLSCAFVAPDSCGKPFAAWSRCQTTGETTEEATPEAPTLPSSWQKYRDPDTRFSVVFPPGVTKTAADGKTIWSTNDQGLTYEVVVQAAPAGPPTQRSLLRAASAYLGRCADKMKLHGMIDEEDGSVSIRFDTRCKDGTVWRGAMHVVGSLQFIVAVRGPSVDDALLGPLLERFRVER